MLTSLQREQIVNWAKKFFERDSRAIDEFDINAEIDSSLSVNENKTILRQKIKTLVNEYKAENVVNLKRKEAEIMPKQQVEAILTTINEKEEYQAKLKFEEQLDIIAKTPTTDLLERLYFVPKEYIKMVLSKKAKGLLLYGEAGLGKSFNVKRALIESNLKEGIDFNFVAGHITPLQLYKKLYFNKEKLIILDDINILESKINLNMLKACLSDNGGIVEYSSSALKDLPNQFYFTGRIIILLNDKPKNNEHLKAVESRILTYHLEMDYNTKISILYDIAKADYEGVSLEERQEICKWIKENTNEGTKNLSIRLLKLCFEFYKWDKQNWKGLAMAYIQNDELSSLILKGMPEKEWCAETGMSRRSYYVYKKGLVQKCSDFDKSVSVERGYN